jgi:hypothetical protein
LTHFKHYQIARPRVGPFLARSKYVFSLIGDMLVAILGGIAMLILWRRSVILVALYAVALVTILLAYLPNILSQYATVNPFSIICHTTGTPIESAIPADAFFQHVHSEQGMADVLIEPGRVGKVSVTIHLLDDDLETLAALTVTIILTAPRPGSKPITRLALRDAVGQWHVDGIELTEPGNWTATVDAVLRSNRHLKLAAPIVIDPK